MERVNLVLNVKQFSAEIITHEQLSTPIKVELLDIGMTPFYEMVAYKNDQGICLFPIERSLSPSLGASGPFTVRFTHANEEPFLRNLPRF
jgi:hypothetical protein